KGYLNGRTTTEDNQPLETPELNEDTDVPEGDFIADADAAMYYVSIDRRGVIGWTRNYVDYGNRRAHVIEVLSEKATTGYKDFLRKNNISYIIAGEELLDNEVVLDKLYDLFGLDRLMIGGGGVLNWSYLQADLVDEVSLVVGPFADGDPENPSLFTATEPLSEKGAKSFSLIEAQPLQDS
ncbi:5-amino-6-(5-phosphoribosylamino)uracil reductase, partial [Klebsiella oxytoca]